MALQVMAKKTSIKILQQFRLPPDLVNWLSKQAEKTGKTKTRILEESLRAKKLLKEAA